MKIISRGNARVDCDQCGSTLEYEWNDIQEHYDDTIVLCPVCGRHISVPAHIESNKYSALRDVNTLTITPDGYYRPYDIFVRDSTTCSATAAISATDLDKASNSTVSVKSNDLTTLTSKC